MRILRKLKNNGKKRLFLVFGLYNFLITNLVLQVLLLFVPIFISTIISQFVNLSFGFYFYGKKVFKLAKLTSLVIKKYVLLALFAWILNTLLIKLLVNYGLNKNLSAMLLVPLMASLSYYFQNKFVFVKD